MKKIAITSTLLAMAGFAYGQQNGASKSASQNVSLTTHNIMEIAFVNTNGTNGNTVLLPFNTLSDYTQGVYSTEQELRIRSNNKFGIEIKTNSQYFDYSGVSSPAPTMPVAEVLNIEVAANSTGGNLLPPFSQGKFVGLSDNNTSIMGDCKHGGNQRFSIKYKAAPGITYPVGNYSVDVIYTATQQ
jgi:hypothetical protein